MIFLKDIWPLEDLRQYKLHFARWDNNDQPLEVLARDKNEWKRWQEYWPGRNDFNRPYIFALAQFYHEPDTWLFGGVYRVIARQSDRYDVELAEIGTGFIDRLKLGSPYRSRTTRVNLENHFENMTVREILREPHAGRSFPGYDDVHLTFGELETLVANARIDWKTALENVKGIYVITDTSTGLRYVGSAYGDQGIWSRWSSYVGTGHGGNVELRTLVTDPSLAYCRSNFQFALLEQRSGRTPDESIIARESYWKDVLLTRGPYGMNRN